MPFQDEWGHDPTVQMMRRIFSRLEKTQEDLFRDLNISFLDRRLLGVRYHARGLFEQTWPLAARKEVVAGEEGAGLLYRHCLGRALTLNGIEVPSQLLPRDDKIVRFLKETCR